MRSDVKNSSLKWVVWGLAAFFYFYEYLLRISPSVMVPELMDAFDVGAGLIGLLAAFYLYAYSPLQLPVGVMMDRFGVRRLLSFASLICGVGTIFFGLTGEIWVACFGRMLIGAGSAFAFVGMIYVCSHWFPKGKQALVIGLANSIGMLGAVFGGGPLSVAVHLYQWRPVMMVLGVAGILLAGLIWVGVGREPAHFFKESEDRHILSSLKQVMKNRYSWINAFVAVFFYLTTSVVGGLWGVPFLQAAYGWDRQAAGFAISMLFIGWMVGGPLIGHISDYMKRRQGVLSASMLVTTVLLCALIFLKWHPFVVYLLLFFIGLFSAAELLNFSYAIEVNDKKSKATAVAFTNCLIALVGSIMQPAIGVLLDWHWAGKMVDGAPSYSLENYHIALSALPILLIVGFLLSFFLREGVFHSDDHAEGTN
ncbi:MAG: MFS transporter [Simkaniaceae bacterium]|nr:MFS transporter [Simkaniaceae bacterium]